MSSASGTVSSPASAPASRKYNPSYRRELADVLVREKFGPEAELRSEMRGGRMQFWVFRPDLAGTAIYWPNLDAVLKELTPAKEAGNIKKGRERKVEDLITVAQAAKIIGCSKSKVGYMTRTGELPIVSERMPGLRGKRILIRRADAEKWVGKIKSRKSNGRRWKKAPTSVASRNTNDTEAQSTYYASKLGTDKTAMQRATAIAGRLHANRFTRNVTPAEVIREALRIGLDQLEKEHGK